MVLYLCPRNNEQNVYKAMGNEKDVRNSSMKLLKLISCTHTGPPKPHKMLISSCQFCIYDFDDSFQMACILYDGRYSQIISIYRHYIYWEIQWWILHKMSRCIKSNISWQPLSYLGLLCMPIFWWNFDTKMKTYL